MKVGTKQVLDLRADTWVKCYETTLAATATSVTISGLTGDTAEEYILRCRFVNGYNGSEGYKLRFGTAAGIDSGVNYGYQYIGGDNTNVIAGRGPDTSCYLGAADAITKGAFNESIIYAKSGYVRTVITKELETIVTTTVTSMLIYGQAWNNTADEIISIAIVAAHTGGLGIGTNIQLWKKVWST